LSERVGMTAERLAIGGPPRKETGPGPSAGLAGRVKNAQHAP
jgi:hypothetical protein